MPAYIIVQTQIIDENAWPKYRAAVGPCVEQFGGRYIIRGAAVTASDGSD